MNFKRIFTFGCSFTKYAWPTWADVIAYQTKIPTFNGGVSGMGNVGIACRVVEYDQRFKFNDDDLILVMWSSWNREDRYIKGNWAAAGNVFHNPFYDDRFLKNHWDWENDIIKNATSMILINKSYKLGDNYFGLGMIEDCSVFQSPLIGFYQNSLPNAIQFHEDQNCFNNKAKDRHPDIINHVNFYNEHIATKFQFPLVENNSVFHKWQKQIESHLNLKQSDDEQKKIIMSYFSRYNSMLSIK